MPPVPRIGKMRGLGPEGREPFTRMTVRITNPNLAGVPLSAIPHLEASGVAVSRLKRAGETEVRLALKDTPVHPGDLLLAVGPGKRSQALSDDGGRGKSGGFDSGFRPLNVPSGAGDPDRRSWANLWESYVSAIPSN